MTRPRTYSRYAKEAVKLLGSQIRLARKERRWTEHELAERAGIGRATLQRIERGDLACSIGLAFELASLLGLRLFDTDSDALKMHLVHTENRIALLPKHVRPGRKAVDDDF